jgi:multidrug efflux pump subunit AcrA (membrane-fusion protein)
MGPLPAFGKYENGLTWFDVQVSYDPGGLPLMMGMGANVEVPLASKEDVLLVPAMAVQRDGEGAFVLVVQGKKTERRRVQLGVSDGIHTEVMRGLEEGEVVRVVLRGPVYPTY